jgi:hypothetical protein
MSLFDTAQLIGPLGGALAAAFGGGAVAGYGFCVKTILNLSNKRIETLEDEVRQEKAECKAAMATLTQRQRELEDMLLGKRPLGFFSETLRPVSSPERDREFREAVDKAEDRRRGRYRRGPARDTDLPDDLEDADE